MPRPDTPRSPRPQAPKAKDPVPVDQLLPSTHEGSAGHVAWAATIHPRHDGWRWAASIGDPTIAEDDGVQVGVNLCEVGVRGN